jgi:hypothetical protein
VGEGGADFGLAFAGLADGGLAIMETIARCGHSGRFDGHLL